jgi:phosphoribosylformylglycinamidine synthase
VVDVMLKPEILDPQGQAVLAALPRLGVSGIVGVRQGKRFELELEEGTDLDGAVLARVEHLASTLLANPVIEDYAVRIEDVSTPSVGSPAG